MEAKIDKAEEAVAKYVAAKLEGTLELKTASGKHIDIEFFLIPFDGHIYTIPHNYWDIIKGEELVRQRKKPDQIPIQNEYGEIKLIGWLDSVYITKD